MKSYGCRCQDRQRDSTPGARCRTWGRRRTSGRSSTPPVSRWKTSQLGRTPRGARAHTHELDVPPPGPAKPGDASQDATEAQELRPECVWLSTRRRGQLHALHRDDRHGRRQLRISARAEKEGTGCWRNGQSSPTATTALCIVSQDQVILMS